MPLSFYRVVCGTCGVVISDGWPPRVPPELCRISQQTCSECEYEVRMQTEEEKRRGQRP